MDLVDIELPYGRSGTFAMSVPESLLAVRHLGPAPVADLTDSIAASLGSPIQFPALRQAVLSDDRIVLALDRHTPEAPQLIRGVWDVLAAQKVDPRDVFIVQPASLGQSPPIDPRSALDAEIREQVAWIRHDPADDGRLAYLATTTAGNRVYLSREVVDADFVLPIGPICFDPVLGHRGTNSVLYPGLSNTAALSSAHGLGHDELGPEDQRALRQTIDEVGWLLGVQFVLQVVPGVGGAVADVLAGSSEAVLRRGQELLEESWRVTLDERVDFVVVAVEADEAGHGWPQLGAALETARRLVEKDGRILVLSQLDDSLTPGLEVLQASRTPRDALQPLRTSTPEDLVEATQIAKAVDWAKVYLLSHLDDDLVEDLFALPLGNEQEATRLIESADRMAVIASAQHVYGAVRRA